MKHIYVVLIVVYTNTSLFAQKNKNGLFLLAIKEMRSPNVKKIKPKVSCYYVDYCTVRYLGYKLIFKKSDGDSISYRRLFVNHQEFKIISCKNEEYETNKYTFPEYEFSVYIFDQNKGLLKIMSSLPGCTGIAYQYQMFQVVDFKNKVCYEKILRYYR